MNLIIDNIADTFVIVGGIIHLILLILILKEVRKHD
jgi:hypothetical protein